MVERFSGDFRIMRVCMATSNPLDTLHKIQNNEYSIRTFLDMIEMLEVQTTMQENAAHLRKTE